MISNFNSFHINRVCTFDYGQSHDIKTQLQNAFENLDIDLILELLSAGADPYQNIKITPKLEDKINHKVINKSYSYKKCIESILEIDFEKMSPNDYQALSQRGDGENFLKRMSSLQKDFRDSSTKVTDEQLKELDLILLNGVVCSVNQKREGQIESFKKERFMTPMDIALILKHPILIQKLTEMTRESVLSL